MTVSDEAIARHIAETFSDPEIKYVTFENTGDDWRMRRFTRVPDNAASPFEAALSQRSSPHEPVIVSPGDDPDPYGDGFADGYGLGSRAPLPSPHDEGALVERWKSLAMRAIDSVHDAERETDWGCPTFGPSVWERLREEQNELLAAPKLDEGVIAENARLREALRKIADHDGVSYRFGDEVRGIANEALSATRKGGEG